VAISIAIEISRDFDLAGSFDEVFELLADVPRSASHFPKIDKLVDLGDNAYRWEMEKIGVDKHAIQTVYACRYFSDREKGQIWWEPVKGEGNGVVAGRWQLQSDGDSNTRVSFHTQAELSLPLPSLLKLAISPVIKHEFNSLVDTYTRNLQAAFQ